MDINMDNTIKLVLLGGVMWLIGAMSFWSGNETTISTAIGFLGFVLVFIGMAMSHNY